MPKAYPLDWPEGLPQADFQEDSKFKTSFDRALQGVRKELKLLGASHVLISCNLPTARDGWPDPRARLRGGPGVAVYWLREHQTYVVACDSWNTVQDNLHAIALTIGADRAKVRWKCAAIESRSMAGYLSLPEPPKPEHWTEVLGVDADEDLDMIEAVYRTRMKRAHPDAGGSAAEANRLNAAIEAARKEKNAA
jgi:hypothetical protein